MLKLPLSLLLLSDGLLLRNQLLFGLLFSYLGGSQRLGLWDATLEELVLTLAFLASFAKALFLLLFHFFLAILPFLSC